MANNNGDEVVSSSSETTLEELCAPSADVGKAKDEGENLAGVS